MFSLKNIVYLLLIITLTSCQEGEKNIPNGKEEKGKKIVSLPALPESVDMNKSACQVTGTIEKFTINCSQPIKSFGGHDRAVFPLQGKLVKGLKLFFKDGDKIIEGEDFGSGLASLDVELILKTNEAITVKIPKAAVALASHYVLPGGTRFERVVDPLLGRVVWKDTSPDGLTWGDDVGLMSWLKAKKYCLNLNPPNEQQKIQGLLSNNANRPSRGYFLPRIEDWRELAQAMGSKKLLKDHSGIYKNYSPAKWFFRSSARSDDGYWTISLANGSSASSPDPFVYYFQAKSGRAFDSINTFIENQGTYVRNNVRCVRAGDPW